MPTESDSYRDSLVDEGFKLCARCDGWGIQDTCIACGGEGQIREEEDDAD